MQSYRPHMSLRRAPATPGAWAPIFSTVFPVAPSRSFGATMIGIGAAVPSAALTTGCAPVAGRIVIAALGCGSRTMSPEVFDGAMSLRRAS